MPEKQVLFRIDAKLLDNLDKRLARDGYTTRNAWFKEVVSGYAGRARKAAAKSASKTATKSATKAAGKGAAKRGGKARKAKAKR